MNYTSPKNSRSRKSRIFNSRIIFVVLAACALLTLATVSALMAPPLPGAVFTSDSSCANVDQNIYAGKAAVYLNGGPAHPGAASLTDGSYYVQVTDPSGATVLGTSVNRTSPDDKPFVVLGGVVMGCYQLSAIVDIPAGGGPGYLDTPNAGGEYKVWVSSDRNFVNNSTKTDNFKVRDSGTGGTTTLSGTKFYDSDADGILDPTELGIGGFEVVVTYTNGDPPASTTVTTFTLSDGSWSIPNIPTGATFSACEVLPSSNTDGSYWQQTAPVMGIDGSRCYAGTVPNTPLTGLDFGNICLLPPKGGFTLGFWSNKNGQALITGSDLCALTALNLKNASGGDFDPVPALSCPAPSATQVSAGKTALKNWLLSANAVNMAYMTSAQLAATKLDTLHGLSPSTNVLLSDDLAACYGANVATISAVMSEANLSLGTNPVTNSDSTARDYQECRKNILDAINNNKLPFVNPTACGVKY